MTTAVELAVGFVRVLRGAGLDVPISSAQHYAEALGHVGLDDRSNVYWAGRATLTTDAASIATYDAAFAAWWEQSQRRAGVVEAVETRVLLVDDPDHDDGEAGVESPDREPAETQVLRYSPVEVLSDRDFALYSAEELAEAEALMARFRFATERQPARRREPVTSGGRELDVRRTVRRAMRTGGEPVRLQHRRRRTRPRRLVFLLDVSGSMEPYARALLRFTQAAAIGRRRVEVFALGTRLTRLTQALASHDPDAALRAAAVEVVDWGGGTRLGECIGSFNDGYGVRGMARGAIVVILSDGWDRGEVHVLDTELGRLQRVARSVVWVNPLKASPGYAPLARGMAAALPHLDRFIEGHSMRALADLASLLAAER